MGSHLDWIRTVCTQTGGRTMATKQKSGRSTLTKAVARQRYVEIGEDVVLEQIQKIPACSTAAPLRLDRLPAWTPVRSPFAMARRAAPSPICLAARPNSRRKRWRWALVPVTGLKTSNTLILQPFQQQTPGWMRSLLASRHGDRSMAPCQR